MKKFFKFIATLIGIAIKAFAAIAAINLVFSYIEERKRSKMPEGGKYFDWKYGRIFYQKRGHGDPVILLHGTDPQQSSAELNSLSGYLASSHTVYTIDLLGFGFSEKPWITYTNFLYVRLIQDFIKKVIGEITDIVAVQGSSLFALQANGFDSRMIGKVVIIDPSKKEKINAAKAFALKLKPVLDFPVIGTFLYNIYSLSGAAPFDKEGRHVFASRLTGHLTTDISERSDLIKENVTVLDKEVDGDFTFGDIKNSLS